jgi:beta-galactosidase
MGPLKQYVEQGGTLVFGCWSGYRDRNHWCYDADGKAFFEHLTGVRVADFTVVIPEANQPSTMRFEASGALREAPIFNEVLASVAGEVNVLAVYESDYYRGSPAVTLHRMGRGGVVYFGSFFTPENTSALLDSLAMEDPLAAWADIPADIQITLRSGESESYCLLLNFASEARTVGFKEATLELLEGRKLQGQVDISPYGVLLVEYPPALSIAER